MYLKNLIQGNVDVDLCDFESEIMDYLTLQEEWKTANSQRQIAIDIEMNEIAREHFEGFLQCVETEQKESLQSIVAKLSDPAVEENI